MTIDLSKIEFTYDFFSSPMPDGSTLILNKVDESLASSVGEAYIDGINITVSTVDGEEIICSSVIGTSNKYFAVESGYSEYLGKTLTKDNLKYCTMELYEDVE